MFSICPWCVECSLIIKSSKPDLIKAQTPSPWRILPKPDSDGNKEKNTTQGKMWKRDLGLWFTPL